MNYIIYRMRGEKNGGSSTYFEAWTYQAGAGGFSAAVNAYIDRIKGKNIRDGETILVRADIVNGGIAQFTMKVKPPTMPTIDAVRVMDPV